MEKVNVDLIGRGGVSGDFAARMMMMDGGFDIGVMKPFIDPKTKRAYVSVYTEGNPRDPKSYQNIPVTNATLRKDEWQALDDAILKISEERLVGVQDLIDKGLTYTLGNAMGTTVLRWDDVSDALEADLTMDGVTRAVGDRPNFQYNYLPIPIIHADYEINARNLAESRSLGNALDTIMAERAARKVSLKMEQMLFTNTSYSYGPKDERDRNTIRSYINHPDRNTVTLGDYGSWDDSATTSRLIHNSVRAMKQASIDAKHYGPWVLYVPTNYETRLDDDYEDTGQTATSKTIRERILQINGIDSIKVIDTLPDDNVLLVQMTSDVVRLVRGMGLQTVQWATEGQFVNKYKVFTIQVPQIRSDQDGNSGIVHMS